MQKREKRGWGVQPAAAIAAVGPAAQGDAAVNPDEIKMDEEEDEGGAVVSEEGPVSEEKGCPSGCMAHDGPPSATANPDEIALDDDEELDAEPAAVGGADTQQPVSARGTASALKMTKFLALNKPGKNRGFLQVRGRPLRSSSGSTD